MKNIGKKITERVKKLLIFFGWGVVGILALIDGWMGDDVFFKTLMSAISAIALIAIAIILYKEGRNFFRNIALPSVNAVLRIMRRIRHFDACSAEKMNGLAEAGENCSAKSRRTSMPDCVRGTHRAARRCSCFSHCNGLVMQI